MPCLYIITVYEIFNYKQNYLKRLSARSLGVVNITNTEQHGTKNPVFIQHEPVRRIRSENFNWLLLLPQNISVLFACQYTILRIVPTLALQQVRFIVVFQKCIIKIQKILLGLKSCYVQFNRLILCISFMLMNFISVPYNVIGTGFVNSNLRILHLEYF